MINLYLTLFILSVLFYVYLNIIWKNNNQQIFGMFFIFTLIIQLVSNISLSYTLCNNNIQWGVSFVSLIPWFFLLLFNIIIKMFPGWLRPFSNTFGYLFVLILGIKKLFVSMLKPKTNTNNQILLDIYNNPSILINEITEDNFKDFWVSSKNIINSNSYNNNTIKEKLFNMVKLKYLVSEGIWYILFGILINGITNNYISSVDCNISLETIQQNDINYNEKIPEKIPEKQKVYNITD